MREIEVEEEILPSENDESGFPIDSELKKVEEGIKLLRQLFTNEADIETEITDLTNEEIRILAGMHTINNILGFDLYDVYAKSFKRLLISKNRRSRLEMIEGIKALFSSSEGLEGSSPEKRNFISRALSGFQRG